MATLNIDHLWRTPWHTENHCSQEMVIHSNLSALDDRSTMGTESNKSDRLQENNSWICVLVCDFGPKQPEAACCMVQNHRTTHTHKEVRILYSDILAYNRQRKEQSSPETRCFENKQPGNLAQEAAKSKSCWR